MQIRKCLNKYLSLTIVILCITVLVITSIGFLNVSNDSTLYIKDIQGDRSVLDNVKISGLIQDRSHGIEFDIQNQDVKQMFSYYNSSEDINYEIMGALQTGDVHYGYQLEYVISADANIETSETKELNEWGYTIKKTTKADAIDYYVVIPRIDDEINWSYIRYNPGTSLISDTLEFEFTSENYYNDENTLLSMGGESISTVGQIVGSNLQDAFTLLDGQLYFTLLSSPHHKGSNGIYKVESFVEMWEFLSDTSEISDEWEMPDENARKRAQYGNVKPIITFSLDEQNMSVLAIKAVNGKLILIVIENDTLILRSYHPETGELMDELPVQELDHEDYGGTLQAFVDDSILNLNIAKRINKNNDEYLISNILLSVDVTDTLSLLHQKEGLQLESGEITPQYIDQMATADQKLFVFASISREEEFSREEEQYGISHDILRPKHNMMFVYQGDEFLYKGEFITDIDEDYISYRERMRSGGSFGYDQYQFRQIYGFQVEGR